MNRAAILVLGMHRSGTSALTWLIGQMGAALPTDPIGATPDNPRGYFESAALVKADDQVLRVARSSWFDPRPLDLSRLGVSAMNSRRARIREAIEQGWGAAPLLAIKDPRQCRMVPVITEVLADMGIEPRALIMLRDPAEIARSLAARDGSTPAFAHLLWLRHMIDAERATRDMARAIVDYGGLLADWRAVIGRVAPLAGREGWSPEGEEAAAIDAFLDPALRHHRAVARATLEEPLATIVAAVDAGLRALAECDDGAARAQLDEAYARLDAAPWLEGDIIHDELRHRRIPSVAPEEAPAPADAAPAEPDPYADLAFAKSLIHAEGLLDADWYLARYPEVAASGLDPIDHYLHVGAAKGYDPSPLFDTVFYARQMQRRMAAAGELG